MSASAQIGKYEIVAPLGSGGFATVYRAVDTTLGRQVALKVLHPQLLIDAVFVQRFYQEARTIATLRHPHIITIYEIGEAGGRLFIAMDLAARSLGERLAGEGRLEWDEVLHLLRGTAGALDHAHAQGVVHRDLKPANILLDGADEPLISDFGFARIVGSSGMSTSLSASTIVGTPGYIAPEVWDENAATPAADIYALGCIVYELLSGRPLFAGATPIQAMRAHDRGPQLEPGWAGPAVPPGLDDVMRRALARDPAARYGSAREFVQSLKALSDAGATRTIPVVENDPAAGGETKGAPALILPVPVSALEPGPPVAEATPGTLETRPFGTHEHLAPGTLPPDSTAPKPRIEPQAPGAAPASTRARPGWLIPAVAVGVLALLGAGFLLFGRGGQQTDSGATATAQAELFAAQLATARAEGEQGAVQTVQAQATATAQAELFAAQLATARAEGAQGGAATVQAGGTATAQAIAATAELEAATANAEATSTAQAEATSVAQVDTQTPEPVPTTAPTSAPAATRVVVPASTRAPVATNAPRQPTATTAPTERSSDGGAVVDGRSVGTLFTGTARQGDTLANPPGNGTCIQGQVRATGGGRFSSFYVQADKGGDTRPAKHFYDTGNYQLCGLDAGEWGVAVYAVNDQPTSGGEQRAHQVRFRASGRTGEIFYIDFIANIAVDEPTAVPTTAAPPTPFALYDGEWVGQLSASSPIAPDGRFSFSVRGGRIISLGASGAACFWTHNSGLSVDVSGGSFSFGGTPNQGTNIASYAVQGSFSSATQASGTLSATDASNNACIVGGSWTATRQ